MPSRIHDSITRAALLGGVLAANFAAAMTPADLAVRLARNENVLVIDLRTSTAYRNGHIPGAMNIPLGLLPHKPLPAGRQVIVYGDGLGMIDDAAALAVVRSKQGANGDVLEGGYAAWLSETRLSTVPPGVVQERLPGITYDQLLAAGKSDMVLLDLRTPETAAVASSSSGKFQSPAGPDIVAAFAAKLGVPMVSANGSVASAVAKAQSPSLNVAASPARAAAPTAGGGNAIRLLVLVADSDTAASEAARQLRASGQYRFTILVGGTETIRREGRIGSGRMDGDVPAVKR